jgi:glycosyltransferase involved in cell wall biosynthesis
MNDTSDLGAGQGLVYELTSPPRWFTELSTREARLLDGAITFHALTRPDSALRMTVLRTANAHFPALTDQRTERIEWADDRTVVGTLTARHRAAREDGAPVDLVIDLGGPAELLEGRETPPGIVHATRNRVRSTVPVTFDVLRQKRTDRLENRRMSRPIPRVGSLHERAPRANRDLPKAVLFGMHWLELGGAEKWANETVAMAKEAGLLPIVVTDQPSAHPDVVRAVFDGALVIPLSHPLSNLQESQLLARLFSEFDIRGIHLHHCIWLYQRLPWISAHFPWVEIVDSLHIVEWRTGGFVDIALRMSNVMDQHHVISPQLRDYLVDRQGLPREKVSLATLADLTTVPADVAVSTAAVTPVPAGGGDPLTVAFVGRLTQQKRPYLFLQLAARLRREHGDRVRFIMHGAGELAAETARLRSRLGLDGVTQVRDSSVPVARTFEEADVLVISSDNEGVTLTSFEAQAAGVLVVSADVGSQASVVADELLLPRAPMDFLKAGRTVIGRLLDDPARRAELARQQQHKMTDFAALPRARDWTRKLYEGWAS